MSQKDLPQRPSFYLDRRRLGILGEELTAKYYRCRGYSPVAANYHTRFGELDLVVLRGKQLIFVEVRTRDENAVITPAETVNHAKQQKVILTAQQYLAQNPAMNDCNMQFDVMEVFYQGEYTCRLNRIENAFTL